MKINSTVITRSLPSKGQDGFAITAFLVGTLIIISLIYTGIAYEISRSSDIREEQERTEYAVQTSNELKNWYKKNAWAIDSDPLAIPSATIFAQAGITQRFGAQIVSSIRLSKNDVDYHVIAFWMPQENLVGTAFDANTGIFTEGVYAVAAPATRLRYTIVNGATIESELINDSFKTMSKMASSLETWFAGKAFQASSYESATANDNWFRDSACVASASYLPCTIGYEASAVMLGGYGISDGNDTQSSWGQDILITNDPAIVPNVRPYSMLLRSVTPWGRALETQITQPSNSIS